MCDFGLEFAQYIFRDRFFDSNAPWLLLISAILVDIRPVYAPGFGFPKQRPPDFPMAPTISVEVRGVSLPRSRCIGVALTRLPESMCDFAGFGICSILTLGPLIDLLG